MKGLLTISGWASTGLMVAFVSGVLLGINQMGNVQYEFSYDRVKVHRKTPMNSINCMSGPWNDCIGDVKRAGWTKNYKARR
ncbi:MAG: hypothetical protein RL326_1294 [Pseudomonadota bacterium]|jgi:hypothetical protein